ncbi:uncharacterized protein G2W53_010598 [Senna tora]|uniref:Uncharacterized protein n=1 Tax=Senna tora TaxID=362788 RepID=A0A835C9X3_9FABA|nr:uncharacterized protein G2W53_010598 [Senna tora]
MFRSRSTCAFAGIEPSGEIGGAPEFGGIASEIGGASEMGGAPEFGGIASKIGGGVSMTGCPLETCCWKVLSIGLKKLRATLPAFTRPRMILLLCTLEHFVLILGFKVLEDKEKPLSSVVVHPNERPNDNENEHKRKKTQGIKEEIEGKDERYDLMKSFRPTSPTYARLTIRASSFSVVLHGKRLKDERVEIVVAYQEDHEDREHHSPPSEPLAAVSAA